MSFLHRNQSPATSGSQPFCLWFHFLRAGRRNQQTGTTRCRGNLTNTGAHGFPRQPRVLASSNLLSRLVVVPRHRQSHTPALRPWRLATPISSFVLHPDSAISPNLDGFFMTTLQSTGFVYLPRKGRPRSDVASSSNDTDVFNRLELSGSL